MIEVIFLDGASHLWGKNETLFEKYGKGRVFFIVYCIFIVLLIAEAMFIHGSYNSANYKDYRLKMKGISSESIVMTDKGGNELTILIDLSGKNCTIHYLTETIQRQKINSFFSVNGYRYTFSDGYQWFVRGGYEGYMGYEWIETDYKSGGLIIPSGPSLVKTTLTLEQKAEKDIVDKLSKRYQNYKSTGFFIYYVFLGMLLLILVLGNFFYPNILWRFQTFLSVKGGEPTDFYISMNGISSVIMIVFIYIGLILIL